jgi:uncharacterized lipoprotein YehR (DUF1307 family)
LAAILEGADALDAAEDLVNQAEEAYFNLGGVLAHIYYEGHYKTAGFDGQNGFGDYTQERLNINYRKARSTGCNRPLRQGRPIAA